MNIIIKTKNLEMTDLLDNLIKKRMEGLKKFTNILKDGTAKLLVEVEGQTKHHKKGDVFKVEAIINVPGKNLVVRTHGENLGKVVTEARDEMEREIRKYKTKIIEKPRRDSKKFVEEIF